VLSAERQGTEGVWLAVSDEGVGIDPDAVERLVTEFSQADGSATREFGGLGLGLALVDRIARAHGGELRCRSREGAGTVVSIFVPVRHGDRQEVTAR
jgi:signal transduction histidine kinase